MPSLLRVLARSIFAIALLAAQPLQVPAAGATTFTDLFFFGASGEDTGVFGPADADPMQALGLVSSYGYDPDRWTNAGGTVWAEDFASALGLGAISRTDGGTNYARGGARTDEIAGSAGQIAQFAADHGGVADPGALYVIAGGGNDMLQGQTTAEAIAAMVSAIEQLSSLGATHFLIRNVLDFGPLAPASGPLAPIAPIPADASAWAAAYAMELSVALATFSDLTIYQLDARALMAAVMADPSSHGFSAGLALCVNDADCVAGVGVDDHLMFDHLHPTAAGHALLAEGALLALADEPSPSACPASPAPGCTSAFDKASLSVNEKKPGAEKLGATLAGGPSLTQSDFGDPTGAGGTSLALCIYDDTGAIAAALEVDRPGVSCAGKPCWRSLGGTPPDGKGFAYQDAAGNASGVRRLVLRAGAAGSSSLALVASNRAKRGEIALPNGTAGALSETASVTLQLHASDAGCFSAVLDDVTLQESDRFKAR